MMTDRHSSKHYEDSQQDTCRYCRRTPALWHWEGSEKVCAHCGTRVYTSTAPQVVKVEKTRYVER
ncbi:MAG: hypothetical protein JNM70_14710 [Anaerolineae bacterium]|nr:hypothetical protein [Anaerolineae bacterium]